MDEGGSSGSSGKAVPEGVEEGELVKKLAAPTAPTASDEKSTWPVGMQCSELGVVSVASDVAECINIVPVVKRPRFQRLPLTTVT